MTSLCERQPWTEGGTAGVRCACHGTAGTPHGCSVQASVHYRDARATVSHPMVGHRARCECAGCGDRCVTTYEALRFGVVGEGLHPLTGSALLVGALPAEVLCYGLALRTERPTTLNVAQQGQPRQRAACHRSARTGLLRQPGKANTRCRHGQQRVLAYRVSR